MNRLPLELIDIILQFCMHSSRKNDVLKLRLVCRAFDRTLKPYVCRTLKLDVSRLKSLSGTQAHPRKDALKTIGDDCKGLYIDMRPLRDEDEVRYLIDKISTLPHMEDFLVFLQTYCLIYDPPYVAAKYEGAVSNLLFNCRQLERLRLQFPSRLAWRYCHSPFDIFSSTIRALAMRPKGLAAVKILILDDIPCAALHRNRNQGVDLLSQNTFNVFSALEHLSLTLDYYHEAEAERTTLAYGIWTLIQQAGLKSLCLGGSEPKPHCSVKQTRPQIMSPEKWIAHSLWIPPLKALRDPHCLRRLELKGLEMTAEALLTMVFPSRDSLRELFLNEISLKVRVRNHDNFAELPTNVLWIGIPNQRPPPTSMWVADNLRRTLGNLRICRASFLGYDQYLNGTDEEISRQSEFDLVDPSGLGRSLSQRFVEIVTGVRQPDDPQGRAVRYLPKRSRHDERFAQLTDRPARVSIADHDANAYQLEVDDTTSRWRESLDGVFPTGDPGNPAEWDHVSRTARDALAEVKRLAGLRVSDAEGDVAE